MSDPSTIETLTVAAIGDLHVTETCHNRYRATVRGDQRRRPTCSPCAGDLTNFGKAAEAEILAEDLRACTIPVVAVLGNHDYEAGEPDEVVADPPVGRSDHARRAGDGDRGRRLRRRQGLHRRLRPRRARRLRRGRDQGLRRRSARRGAQARKRASLAPDRAGRRRPPLRADPRDGGGRAARNLSRSSAPRASPMRSTASTTSRRWSTATPIAAPIPGRTPGGVPVFNCAQFVVEPAFGRPYALLEI